MAKLFVERSIEIDAPVSKVWRVFTDPVLSRQMGGEYVTNWKVGSPFGWKALNGQMYTNGVILKIEPEKILQHTLLNPDTSSAVSITSVITYELRERDQFTTLLAREDFQNAINDTEYADAMDGWEAALLSVKEIAEK
jgi:uncharacterized protein YndB with AHSA1/START domain